MNNVTRLKVRLGEKVIEVQGRKAWALHELMERGQAGFTTLEAGAPRLAAYVHKLRKDGIVIESIPERHEGPYSGEHARYRLTSPVEVVETRGAA